MKQWDISEFSALKAAAREVYMRARDLAPSGATVLALSGDLGAGKTTFMQIFADLLGVHEPVTSPTYTIMRRYETADQQFHSLTHIDAYRIEKIDEMRVLGFAALLGEKDTIIGIEWAENIAELLPEHRIDLDFKLTGDKRTLTITHG